MTFQPVVPMTGYTGWRFLERTLETQQTVFANSQPVKSDTVYFRENIAKVTTAQDIVDDRRLLSVALGAFGLDDDINNRFFIRKILEEGTSSDDALANRIADNRYADFSQAFGFGDPAGAMTTANGFADTIIGRYETRQFERAVGNQDNDLRLALSVQSGLADIISRNSSTAGQWFSVMGNAPMRHIFQTALGLPDSISGIDVDQQRDIFQERAKATFGTDDLYDFTDPARQEDLIRTFLIRSEAATYAAASGASTALALLQSSADFYA